MPRCCIIYLVECFHSISYFITFANILLHLQLLIWKAQGHSFLSSCFIIILLMYTSSEKEVCKNIHNTFEVISSLFLRFIFVYHIFFRHSLHKLNRWEVSISHCYDTCIIYCNTVMIPKPKKKWSFKKVISGVKLSLWLVWCWPMPKDTSRFKITCMNLYQYLCMILTIGVEISVMYTATIHLDDFATFIKAILEQAAFVHTIFNIIFYKANYNHIQVLNINMFYVTQFANIYTSFTHTHTHTRARVYYLYFYV